MARIGHPDEDEVPVSGGRMTSGIVRRGDRLLRPMGTWSLAVMLTNTAPMRAVANCVSSHSNRLGDQIPTRSPFAMPKDRKPAASRSTRSSSWPTPRARSCPSSHLASYARQDSTRSLTCRLGCAYL